MMLRTAGPVRTLILLVMVEAVALAVVATFSDRFSRGLVLVIAGLAVIEAEASWAAMSRIEVGIDRLRTLRIIEISVAFLVIRLGQVLVAPGPTPGIGWETAIALIAAVAAWNATTRSLADFDRLGDPPEREDRYVPPMEALWSRFSRGLVVLVVAAVFASVPLASLFNLDRDPITGLFIPGLVYLVMGLVVLSAADFIDRRIRWERDQVSGLEELQAHWREGLLVRLTLGASAVALVAFAAWQWLNRAVFGPVEIALDAVRLPDFVFGGLGATPDTSGDGEGGLQAGGEGLGLAEGTLAREVYDRAFSVLIALMAGYVVFRIVRALILSPPPALQVISAASWKSGWSNLGKALLAVPEALLRGLRGLFRWVASLFGGRNGAARQGRTGGKRRSPAGGLNDPHRRRIAELYHAFLDRAGERWRPRSAAETPREFHRRATPRLGDAREPASHLTDLFAQARWSGEEPTDQDVAAAEETWDDIDDAFNRMDESPQ